MATILERKNRDGSTSFLAQVRIKKLKPVSKSFPAPVHATRAQKAAAKKEALDWAAAHETALREQLKRGGIREDVATLNVKQLVQEFLDDENVKAKKYHADLSLLLAWWVNHYAADKVMNINVLTLRAARDKLKTGRAPGTVNRYLSAMRSCWNWGRASGLIAQNQLWPESKLMLTEPRGRVRFLSDDELARLKTASSEHSPLMYAAVLTSIACGMRQGELLRLEWKDVDLDKGFIRILLTKNTESRSVYLPANAADALRELKRAAVVGKRVFITDDGKPVDKNWLEHKWKKVRAAAGLHDFKWHDLRHTCASILAQNGATLLQIGSVLGHKSVTMTARYSHLVQGAAVTGHDKLNEKLGGGK